MLGSMDRGTPMTLSISGSQSRVARFISIVRLALLTSVTCTPPLTPPVRFQMHQVSMLPNIRSPASAFACAPGTLSRIHLTFGPEKYVARGSPTLARKRSWPPSLAHPLMSVSVLVSCQTMAL
jgi:hypothetical protein